MSIDGIRGTTTLTGVFGYPVTHSASPSMHNSAFAALNLDWAYVPFAVAPESIEAAVNAVRALAMRGVNVTVPLKELIPPLMDSLTHRARVLGAVNTIVNDDGKLVGDSTDGPGFLASLAQAGVDIGPGTRSVVLGAGGSGRAIALALAEAGSEVVIANRNRDRADALARDLSPYGSLTAVDLCSEALLGRERRASLLVNTTSVGMHPDVTAMPAIPLDALTPELFVYDLIYNPRETALLAAARERGCRVQNGIEMLVQQGALSFEQWTGVEPPIDVMRGAVNAALDAPPRSH